MDNVEQLHLAIKNTMQKEVKKNHIPLSDCMIALLVTSCDLAVNVPSKVSEKDLLFIRKSAEALNKILKGAKQ